MGPPRFGLLCALLRERCVRARTDPHEQEILFGPLTGMQLMKTRVDGGSIVAEVRLSVNLNALTIEQAPLSLLLPSCASPHPILIHVAS